MEFVLIAWFSLIGTEDYGGNYGYGYGFTTSITQEFYSEEACENAGQQRC